MRRGIVTPSFHTMAVGVTMSPWFRDARPVRAARAAALAHLTHFRQQRLGCSDAEPAVSAVTADSTSSHASTHRAVARRIRGLEVQAAKPAAPADAAVPTPMLELAAARFVGREAIHDFTTDVSTIVAEWQQQAPFSSVGAFLWTAFALSVPVVAASVFAGGMNAGALVVCGLASPLAPFRIARHTRAIRQQLAASAAHSGSPGSWHYVAYDTILPSSHGAYIGQRPAPCSADAWAYKASTVCVWDCISPLARYPFLLLHGGQSTWVGIDHLFDRDPETAEPSLTVVMRKASQAPVFPQSATAPNRLSAQRFRVGEG